MNKAPKRPLNNQKAKSVAPLHNTRSASAMRDRGVVSLSEDIWSPESCWATSTTDYIYPYFLVYFSKSLVEDFVMTQLPLLTLIYCTNYPKLNNYPDLWIEDPDLDTVVQLST